MERYWQYRPPLRLHYKVVKAKEFCVGFFCLFFKVLQTDVSVVKMILIQIGLNHMHCKPVGGGITF